MKTLRYLWSEFVAGFLDFYSERKERIADAPTAKEGT